jgi:hypothetical protein
VLQTTTTHTWWMVCQAGLALKQQYLGSEMKLTLYLHRETEAARLYSREDARTADGKFWVPRSVCPRTMKYPPAVGGLPRHEVEIEGWG